MTPNPRSLWTRSQHGGVLRDMEQRDQTAVRDLILTGMRERWQQNFDAAVNPDVDDMWSSYVVNGGEVVVWDEVGDVVGTGTLVPESNRTGRILRMSVHPTFRRRGIGRSIVCELIARARRRGLHRVVVATDTPWTEAVALYAACGFDVADRTDSETHFTMALGVG